ncbi:MAG: YciI family protein [Pseudoxanthomonas sp.]
MKVMVMVRATAEGESEDFAIDPELMEAMGRFNEELAAAGVLLAADGLKPSRYGARIRYDGARRQVIDGPFAETKELIAGFWLWQVRSLDEAIEWAKRSPNPFHSVCEVEIRPLYELDDPIFEDFSDGRRERKRALQELFEGKR